jgi:hypothetical protein
MAAIRNADTDGNPATVKDAGWTPLFNPSLPASIGGVGPTLITPLEVEAYTHETQFAFVH